MEILIMQVFVSLLLALGGVLLFLYSHKQADHEHADRLSLFPIEDDEHLKPGGASGGIPPAAPDALDTP